MLGVVTGRVLDLGCGEGQVLRAAQAGWKLGCDLSPVLLEEAADAGAVVQCRLPDLSWLRDDAVDAAVCVLVLEHLERIAPFFEESARVIKTGGVLALVMNHPAYTADGAGPVIDLGDGEVMWRWGDYFGTGSGTQPAGSGSVVFHHRALADILNTAARAGLSLDRVEERGVSPESVARDPAMAGQEHMPRLLAARWRVGEPQAPAG
jgi:SAM-dependent methyltransferase